MNKKLKNSENFGDQKVLPMGFMMKWRPKIGINESPNEDC